MSGIQIEQGPVGSVVASNLAALREACGFTYAELSRRVKQLGRNLPVLSLRRIEEGQRRVDVDDLVVLAAVYDVAPEELIKPGQKAVAVTRVEIHWEAK